MNVAVARTAKIVDPIAALASEDAVGAAEAAPPESPAAPAVSASAAIKPRWHAIGGSSTAYHVVT